MLAQMQKVAARAGRTGGAMLANWVQRWVNGTCAASIKSGWGRSLKAAAIGARAGRGAAATLGRRMKAAGTYMIHSRVWGPITVTVASLMVRGGIEPETTWTIVAFSVAPVVGTVWLWCLWWTGDLVALPDHPWSVHHHNVAWLREGFETCISLYLRTAVAGMLLLEMFEHGTTMIRRGTAEAVWAPHAAVLRLGRGVRQPCTPHSTRDGRPTSIGPGLEWPTTVT